MHKKDLDGAREAKQAELRQKFGESAKAEAGALSSEIIAWTKDQKGRIGAFYPDFANWLADKLNDHWEIVTVNSDVQDFGTADFERDSRYGVFENHCSSEKPYAGRVPKFLLHLWRMTTLNARCEGAGFRQMRRRGRNRGLAGRA